MKKLLAIFLIASLVLPATVMATTKTAIPVYNEQKTSIVAGIEQPEFIIQLPSNPTTGYSWFLKEYNVRYLKPVKHRFQAPKNHKLIGAPGYELWTFKMNPAALAAPHQTTLRFVYIRPWEKGKPSTGITFSVSTTGKH